MTRGSKEVNNYYTIKARDVYLKNISIGYSMEDGSTPLLRSLEFTIHESDAKKWYFDSLVEVGDKDCPGYEKDFAKVLQVLEDYKMSYEVLKTTTTTIEERKGVAFIDGKEVELDSEFQHISSVFGLDPALLKATLSSSINNDLDTAIASSIESAKIIGDAMKSVLTRLEDKSKNK